MYPKQKHFQSAHWKNTEDLRSIHSGARSDGVLKSVDVGKHFPQVYGTNRLFVTLSEIYFVPISILDK